MKIHLGSAVMRGLLVLLALGQPVAAADNQEISAPPLLLASVLQQQTDVSKYWVSEKLDGARAIWNGKELRFRSGRLVNAPAWFTEKFPAQPLDGELWLARGEFDRLSAIVRKQQPIDAEWRQVRYMLFELPEAPGTFTERIASMREIVDTAHIDWLEAIKQFRVRDRAELQRHLTAVLKNQGEGLMLHLADAPYATGRGDVLLKLKPWFDAEATVIEHVTGQGKYLGMMGALLMETPAGRRFRLGTGFTDAVRRDPPTVGTLVTYRYRELNSNGLPRFASYLRVRETF